MIKFNRYYDGAERIVTMSYDDGREYDRKLTEIFDRYGIRGTFHLNSGMIGKNGYIVPEDIPEIYKNHEVSVHSLTHPFLNKISDNDLMREITEDKKNLEEMCGYVVRGMSYPFGAYTDELIAKLGFLGMEYSRTVVTTMNFSIPDDFMKWHPTCHHKNPGLMDAAKRFLENRYYDNSPLLYVWGHSYEFPADDNWDVIERFCDYIARRSRIWYATNIEILDYITAMKSLKISADNRMVYNPSAVPVWFTCNGDTVKVGAGETLKL